MGRPAKVVLKNCPDCGVSPNQLHKELCDRDICPRCGCQATTCCCIDEVNGLDEFDEEYESYEEPTAEMWREWDKEWGPKRLPWPGSMELEPVAMAAKRYGWYVVSDGVLGRVSVSPDHPGALPDGTKVLVMCYWDRKQGAWVLSKRLSSTDKV